jgi:hypothetical protein
MCKLTIKPRLIKRGVRNKYQTHYEAVPNQFATIIKPDYNQKSSSIQIRADGFKS